MDKGGVQCYFSSVSEFFSAYPRHRPIKPWLWCNMMGHERLGPEYSYARAQRIRDGVERHHVFLTIGGAGRYHWQGRTIVDRPGTLSIMPATDERVGWGVDGELWDYYFLCFIGSGFVDWARQFDLSLPRWSVPVEGDRQRELVGRFESLIRLGRGAGAALQLALQRDAFNLFASALEIVQRAPRSIRSPVVGGRDLLTCVDEYLSRGGALGPDRVDDVARRMRATPGHLTRVFRARTGMSLKRYFIVYRINEAKRLLRETPMPVARIGERLGYPNAYHFSKLFRQQTGQTPSAFRTRGDQPPRRSARKRS